MGQRLFGVLTVWIASENGGHGYVDTANGDRYFVHRRFLRSGDPRPGASAIFSALPPANGGKYPRAIDAVFNSNTEAAKGTKIPAKPTSGESTNHCVVSAVEVPKAVAILSGTEERVKNI